jgi:hypothetical protein
MTMKNSSNRKESLYDMLRQFIEQADINLLVFGPVLLAFGGWLTCAFGFLFFTGEPVKPPLSYVIGGLAGLISSLSGVTQIIRKEMPGPFGLKGKVAVLNGALMFLLFAGLGITMIVAGILASKS